MTPWWIHNYQIYGQFVQLDLGAGVTFLLENSRSYELHGLDWTVEPPWQPFLSITNPVARDHAMLMAAVQYAIDNPAMWLRGCFDRALRFFQPLPLPGAGWRQTVLLFGYTFTIYLLAVVSLALNRWRRLACVLLPLFFITAVHLATHAQIRYRLPIDPLLIVVAAGGVPRLKKARVLPTRPITSLARIVDPAHGEHT
jgi:uncharacterized membrane protein YhdT